MRVVKESLSREDEIILEEKLMDSPVEYLSGYYNSYKDNRMLLRRVLEQRGVIQEPAKIRAYRLAIMRKFEPA